MLCCTNTFSLLSVKYIILSPCLFGGWELNQELLVTTQPIQIHGSLYPMCWESWLMSFQGHSPWSFLKDTEIKDPQWLEVKIPTHSYSFRKSRNHNVEKITEPISPIQEFPVFQLAHTAFYPFIRHHQRRVWLCCLYCPLQLFIYLDKTPPDFPSPA